jgi:glycine/D-amino acid oxidase-like deaminating enzyme
MDRHDSPSARWPPSPFPKTLGRSAFLKTAGAFATAAVAFAAIPARAAQVRSLTPVSVSLDRVTRTTVGLRPYRAGGFVVRAEGHDRKTIVHDFGHGGGGMSLSWGTALLGLELAVATQKRRAAVIGCGVIGLSTARVLQDAGFEVTIYARAIPPDTTSNMSGAQWTPTSVYDDDRVDDVFRAAFARASRLAYLRYQTLLGDDYGVRWIENYQCYDDPDTPFPGGAATALISDLYPEMQMYGPAQHPFPTRYARRFLTMLIEPNRYLRALLRDYTLRGGRVVIRDFGSLADLLALDEPLVMNCAGLGAKELTGDTQLEPIRGQLSVLAPQPAVDYITLHGAHYMFPRSDGIVLGGTFQHGIADLQPDPATQANIVADHAAFFSHMHV